MATCAIIELLAHINRSIIWFNTCRIWNAIAYASIISSVHAIKVHNIIIFCAHHIMTLQMCAHTLCFVKIGSANLSTIHHTLHSSIHSAFQHPFVSSALFFKSSRWRNLCNWSLLNSCFSWMIGSLRNTSWWTVSTFDFVLILTVYQFNLVLKSRLLIISLMPHWTHHLTSSCLIC